MTKLLLAGATGLVGGEALALSLADERVTQVVAPTRRPLPPHPKLLNRLWKPAAYRSPPAGGPSMAASARSERQGRRLHRPQRTALSTSIML